METRQADPAFWNDQARARKTIEAANRCRTVLTPFDTLAAAEDDVGLMLELGAEEEDEHQRDQALRDASQTLDRAETTFAKLETQSLLSGELDANNAYLSLHAGAGGTESCDWADMLYRMYRKYLEEHGYEVEVLELQAGDETGLKSITISAAGPFAYGYLKMERGVHRLVRISPFDANSRRHTSFAAVDIVAEVDDDIDVELADEDLRVDTFRASGAGGQHVNTTDSAVRVTHMPTGIVVSCQAERSQHKNRSKAMKVLKSRVYEWMLDQKRKDLEKFYGEKGEIAWGSQIRSYVMQPYTMVKDHRTSTETSNVSAVLDGAIHPFIESALRLEVAKGK